MVVPKPGTQHHALGHGRVPTSVIYGAGVSGVPSGGYVPSASIRSVSSSTTVAGGYGRSTSSRSQGPAPNETFKGISGEFQAKAECRMCFRYEVNAAVSAGGKRRWDGFTVNEEDEY
jgi:protein regulator of cytokinesis 1